VPNKLRTTLSIANNTIAAIQALTLLPDATEMPSWLGGPLAGRSVHEFVPLANGLLDLQLEQQRQAAEVVSFSDGASQPSASYASSQSQKSQSPLRPHTPLLFTATCLPVLYDPQAMAPHWNQFCQTSLDADEEKLSLLQEWFGYCLTPDTSQQRFLLLEGEGRNGKSVVCAALTALLGYRNVSQVRLEQFDDDYSLAETLGKLANIVSEVGEVDRVAEGVLKSFTAGDRIMSNRKFKSYLSFVPTARLILATNNRPRFSDRSQGLWRRMLILPLDHYVTDAERVYGMDQQSFWEPELSGMLNWALQGLFALREQRGFTVPQASVRALDDYRDEANPCREFLTEHYEQVASDTQWVESTEMYSTYAQWCKSHGYQPLNSKNFGKEIRRAFPACERRQERNGEARFWCYVRLRTISGTETDSLFA
jgi:putative DNA primase/helicase